MATLMNNQIYNITVKIRGQEVKLWYTSKYSPFYSTAKMVKGDIGESLKDKTDDDVNRQIYQASLEVDAMFRDRYREPPVPATYAMKQYARYKAAYDLVHARYLEMASNFGMKDKSLDKLRISEQQNLPKLTDLMSILHGKMSQAKQALLASMYVEGKVQTVVRGGVSNPYPSDLTRVW